LHLFALVLHRVKEQPIEFFDAGSTTTASICLPITPPFLLISSIVINATSLSDVSEIAIVPDNEWSIPTFIGPLDSALVNDGRALIVRNAISDRIFRTLRLFMRVGHPGVLRVFRRNGGSASTVPAA